MKLKSNIGVGALSFPRNNKARSKTMTNEENKQMFKTRIFGAVKQECSRITGKNCGRIGYNDGKFVISRIELIFSRLLGYCPAQVDAANSLSLAFIAPTVVEKARLIKRVGIAIGGTAGLGTIITGIGMIAGWGTGVIAAIKAWFIGVSLAGPIGWIAGGVSLVGIAAYFYFRSDEAGYAEKFERSLLAGLDRAINVIWDDKGGIITEKILQMHAM